MINILIVDDEKHKMDSIECAILNCFTSEEVDIRKAYSLATADALIKSDNFQMMILDMNVPMRDDSDMPEPNGGLRFLEQLKRKSNINPPTHIIGLTAYDILLEEHRSEFNRQGWVLVKYDNTTNWEDVIKEKLFHIMKSETPKTKSQSTLGVILGIFLVLLIVVTLLCAILGVWPCFAITVIALVITAVIYVIFFFNIGLLTEGGFTKLLKMLFEKLSFTNFRKGD